MGGGRTAADVHRGAALPGRRRRPPGADPAAARGPRVPETETSCVKTFPHIKVVRRARTGLACRYVGAREEARWGRGGVCRPALAAAPGPSRPLARVRQPEPARPHRRRHHRRCRRARLPRSDDQRHRRRRRPLPPHLLHLLRLQGRMLLRHLSAESSTTCEATAAAEPYEEWPGPRARLDAVLEIFASGTPTSPAS